jgi:hypothetical protein
MVRIVIVSAASDSTRMVNVIVAARIKKMKLKSMPRKIPKGAVSRIKTRVSRRIALVM